MVSESTKRQQPLKQLQTFMEERLPLAELQHLAEKKKVPMHRHSVWYYLGGIAGMLLAVQLFPACCSWSTTCLKSTLRMPVFSSLIPRLISAGLCVHCIAGAQI